MLSMFNIIIYRILHQYMMIWKDIRVRCQWGEAEFRAKALNKSWTLKVWLKRKWSELVITYRGRYGPSEFSGVRFAREEHFYQDNESATKLESNGRASVGGKSRHINIGYFFIRDTLIQNSTRERRTENGEQRRGKRMIDKPVLGRTWNITSRSPVSSPSNKLRIVWWHQC